MKKIAALLTGILLLAGITVSAQCNLPEEFANAQWIAMDADSTILFPHVHLLKAKSEKGQSLKAYELPVLTKTATLKEGKVKRAWVDICGLGQYELYIGDSKVGNYFLSPGWTMYDKRLLYNELDVTSHLKSQTSNLKPQTSKLKTQPSNLKSQITIKVMLGGGMYDIPLKGYHKMGGSCGAPKLLFCLHVEFEDGSTQTIVSDETWEAEPSPVRYASIYAGEHHDASFQAKRKPVVLTKPHWDVPLVRQQEGTFIKVKQELLAAQLNDNLYDLGQNCSGIVRIKVRGKGGRSITLRPAEVLKDGKIYQRCMPGYEWKYTLGGEVVAHASQRGTGEDCHAGKRDLLETWQPQFSYTGFRYVEVQADEGVELLELTGLHTTTDAPEVSSFECSDTLFNNIHSLIDWAIRSNLVSITTDCPTREKLGWQEQNHLMAYSMMYRYDMRPLMNKIADDLADSQHDDGAIPTIAPEYVQFDAGSGFEDTPEWGASFILCPWYTYQWYGDDSALRKHYDGMKRYIDYLLSRADGYILDYGLGDWFDMGPERPGKAQLTSVALTATAMLYYELKTMQQIALHLGHDADAAQFAEISANVKQAFNLHFSTGDEHVYENGSQTGLAMALYMNLVTDSTRQPALEALVRDIERRGYALTAGDVGFRYVLQALQQNGRSDIIYKMNHNDSVPGYAYQLKNGATALTESWQAYDNVSNNHLMLGHLMEWLYGGLGGIRLPSHQRDYAQPLPSHQGDYAQPLPSHQGKEPGERSNAWQHILIAPQMVGDITWAKTSLNTPHGLVSCHWTKTPQSSALPNGTLAQARTLNSQFFWSIEVTIPEGSDAEIVLPDGRRVNVKEGKHTFNNQ
ncbi:MAG: family 78 glycoside hydrolase catalytic domain [Prevotella sp.]|nr:family 78 glycoside hydrolase catalytic domain [Prevotella sp.]